MNARDVARRVLRRVDEGAYATLALAGELARAKSLLPADRALATELTYGVLKQRRRIDHALAAYAPRGVDKLDASVLDALRIGAYQILFLRVPAHAAVDDAVEIIKRSRSQKLANFANGLLRALARSGEPATTSLGVRCSAPDWLVDDAVARFGADEAERFLSSLNAPAPLWLRANTLRATRDEAMHAVAAERPNATLTPSPVVPEAFRVDGAGDVAQLAAFAGGLVTAQDVAAQMIARLVAAAYDRVLLDAPCSGLGVLRRHPEAKWRRTPADAAPLASLQAKLLDALAPRVRPGGVLVYSVCTYTDEEGPAQLARFVAAHPAFTVDGDPLRTWPHRDDGDGFFAVRLVRGVK
jgi:16S rRNA (cytosine967-C5)-methyltransferase